MLRDLWGGGGQRWESNAPSGHTGIDEYGDVLCTLVEYSWDIPMRMIVSQRF